MNAVPLLFVPTRHPLAESLRLELGAEPGALHTRRFPDGETYVRIQSPVQGRHCVILADLARPDERYLPLAFLAATLRELGAASIGLVVPYLPYMRQDCRFQPGEALTSRIFASGLSALVDWLVTMDPHLHRYRSLDELYSIPSRVVAGAPLLARWLRDWAGDTPLVVVGPDAESEQWVAEVAGGSGQPFVVGCKRRSGDREVAVELPALGALRTRTAMIVDDVVSSGHTILRCAEALRAQGVDRIGCLAVHGLFAEEADARLAASGLVPLVTTNTVAHASNAIDVAGVLAAAARELLQR